MGAKVDAKGGSDYERPEAGMVVASCIQCIELGTHDKTWEGKKSKQVQLLIVWELDQLMEDGKPFVVNWKGTASIGEKANLRKILESWRGKKFTDNELECFELKNIIGKPCLINLVEKKAKTGDKIYINVETVTPLMKGQTAPDVQNPLVNFSIDSIGGDEFEKCYDWVKKIIMESDEGLAFAANGGTPDSTSSEAAAATEDEIPF
jgi:hypothetical protein